jgi:hypothetical protein
VKRARIGPANKTARTAWSLLVHGAAYKLSDTEGWFESCGYFQWQNTLEHFAIENI